jgi:hypothetical protein
MQLQHVSWAELQQCCMHVAPCFAAKYKPGALLKWYISKKCYILCVQGLQ